MAPKSDFAQKLLHDLRLRKERMGASQGSARNHATTKDTFRDPGYIQRGSQQPKSLKSQIGGSKSTNQQLLSSRGSDRTLNIKETSQQIVPYSGKQHRRSESVGDLSMAITYAVKNGGNIMNMDFSNSGNANTMIDFLNQIGRRSLDAGNSRNGTMTSVVKHRPALTTIQIKEISKGVQNLYEIIRSTSNGTNINRYSMEVGKELLKGAKGLEESLRMLVNLQEASEMMVNSQRKSRITLLEVDDDDEVDERSKIVERNQVALPRFSFDKPVKKMNLPVTDRGSKFSSHCSLASGDADSVGRVSSAKPAPTRSEKGRISNVIAKLMGLEEVPLKVESCSGEYEIKKDDDLNKKTSRPVKDVVVSLNDKKPLQIHDLNTNGESRMNQSNKNKMSDRISETQELQSNNEPNEKLHSKLRSSEAAANLQVEKKKTVRTEKSNEIKLVARSEAAANLQVEKKKTVRTEKSNEIKLVARKEAAANLQVEKKKTVRTEKSNEIKLVAKNNQVQEPERKAQMSKQEQIKQVKNTNSISKESKPQPVEGKQKVKDSTPKAQEHERKQQKMVLVTQKKVDSIPVGRTESPRAKDEALRRRNRSINNLSTPSKHKLLVLKETNRNKVRIPLKPKEINTKRSISNASKTESTTPSYDIVPVYKNETYSDLQITSEIIAPGNIQQQPHATVNPTYSKATDYNAGIPDKSNLSETKPKKASYSSIRVALTEKEKQLKEILIKDQLFLSTAEALFKLNIPVGFLHVDDHNHHNNETKLKLECGYEILKRKARSQELSVHPYAKPSIGDTSIRFLDELVKQLYKDLEGLRFYGRDTRNEYDETDYLHHMLEKDIYNKNPDINSFWDFGWHITSFTFVEKDEFVNDVEQDMLCRLLDDIVDDLLSM